MIKSTVRCLAILGFLLPIGSIAKPEAISDLLLEVNGKIFSKDTFPADCKDFFRGVKCNVDSFGKYHLESKKEGDLVHNHVVFTGPEGQQSVEDSWERGGRVQKTIFESRVLQKRAQLEVRNGKVFYELTNLKDMSVKKAEDDAVNNLVVPSTMMNYIKSFGDQITKGEKIQVKVAVFDRLDSYTFNIQKVREDKTVDGEPTQILEMSPASIIVSAVVKPMYFYVKSKSGELFAFEGESGLRKKVGDSWEKLQVRSEYEYKNYAPVTAPVAQKECDSSEIFDGKTPMKCEVKGIR